jgi:hypothetical protein
MMMDAMQASSNSMEPLFKKMELVLKMKPRQKIMLAIFLIVY